jgi:ketosteroid isomerase-like protein
MMDSKADARESTARGAPASEGKLMTEEMLREFGRAWGRKNVDEIMSYLTDDCVYLASVGPEPGEIFQGETMRAGIQKMLAYDAGGQPGPGSVRVFGNVGIAEWSYIHRRDDGSDYGVRGCDIMEFRDGKISRKDAFRKTVI